LNKVEGREKQLLEAVAPFVYVGHNMDINPEGGQRVVRKMIEKRIPEYDYKYQLKKLLLTLVERGKRQDVISYTERLRLLPGMQEIFDSLTREKR
jgi:hypothetical protein